MVVLNDKSILTQKVLIFPIDFVHIIAFCYIPLPASPSFPPTPHLLSTYAIPCTVIIYSSWFPLICYKSSFLVREHIRSTYFSKPMTAEQKRIQIMQNLKVVNYMILNDTSYQELTLLYAIIFVICDELDLDVPTQIDVIVTFESFRISIKSEIRRYSIVYIYISI